MDPIYRVDALWEGQLTTSFLVRGASTSTHAKRRIRRLAAQLEAEDSPLYPADCELQVELLNFTVEGVEVL